MQVALDNCIVFHLFEQVVHLKLLVEWQDHFVDFCILETHLFSTKQLANELAVHVMILVEITLAANKI